MGCWGITAFESDTGLDTVDFIRSKLPENGVLELEKIIEEMRQKEWCVPEVTDLASHTGPMALSEMIVKFQDEDISDMDYDEEWATNQNKFSKVKSFTVTGESVQWLRDYKALGNSVAIPCVVHVLRGIAYFLHKYKLEQEESECTSTPTT